jgi:hypothetical protein
MAKQKISNSDLLWVFHEKLVEHGDHPVHGISLAIIRGDKGEWRVATQRKLPKREPDLLTRINAIEKQLRKQYVLAAE